MATEKLIYGHCQDCNKQLNAPHWCNNCEIFILKNNFKNWTSGITIIDEFIKYTQLNSKENMDYMEWIEYDQFELVTNSNKQGAYSSIYTAFWMEGPKLNINEKDKLWTRCGPTKVILKRMNNSQTMSKSFINQLYRYYHCLQCKLLADYFGMTKDPSSCIMFVMGFYNSGNLYEYLNNTFGVLCWRDIIDILLSISAGIKFIHENNLIHGNLHGGNILIEDDAEMEGIEARISDSGLNVFVNECGLTNKIYGVVPFIAPEIFHGKSLTNKSDIYSFGMIMWMLSAGVRPYNDRAHNESLMHEICQGLRPQVIYGTPQVFAKLMSKCLDDNPLNRPTALQIYDTLDKWDREINEPEDNDLTLQFDSAEEIRFVNFKPSIQINHNDAIYHSRIFEIKLN